MKTPRTHRTPNKIRTALIGTALVAAATCVLPADAVMIFDAIGDDGSGPPGTFDGSITASASTTIGAGRAPNRAINGSGIVLPGGDPTNRDNYEHSPGTNAFGDEHNWGASAPTGWYKVDLGQTYTLVDAFFFNFNTDGSEPPTAAEDRGVATANMDAAFDPGGNTDGNASAFDSTGWTQLGGTHNFTMAPTGNVNQATADVITFGGVDSRFVALDILSNHGSGSSVGIGEIQFFGVPIPDPPIDLAVIEDTLGVTFTNSVPDATYRLQSTPDLVSSNYTDTGAIAIGNGGTITMFDPAGTSTSKNYRVVAD